MPLRHAASPYRCFPMLMRFSTEPLRRAKVISIFLPHYEVWSDLPGLIPATTELSVLYVIFCLDKPDREQVRLDNYEAHKSYLALPALPVTRENLLDAWKTVYHTEAPASVRNRMK